MGAYDVKWMFVRSYTWEYLSCIAHKNLRQQPQSHALYYESTKKRVFSAIAATFYSVGGNIGAPGILDMK